MASTSIPPGPTAAQLKEEGNRLYAAADYRAAYDKYSQAIEVDPTSAVLFSNRAACSIGLKKYEDVVADATKATILDPSFTRAWLRLGEGLKNTLDFYDSTAAYATALYSLPQINLSQSELNFKQRCKDELKLLSVKATRKTVWFLSDIPQEEMPWLRVYQKKDEILNNPETAVNTSGCLLLDALLNWLKGLELVRDFKPQRTPRRGSQTIDEKELTNNQPLHFLTDGLLRDPRIFFCDIVDFAEKLSDKVTYDADRWNIGHLLRNDDPEYLIREVQDILRGNERNWDLARPWLTFWVRHKIFRAFGDDDTAGTPEVSLEDYARVFRVVDWVHATYPDVPHKTRGVIFSEPYVNGIKLLKMDSLIRLCITNLGPGNPYPPEQFHTLAQEVLAEIEGNNNRTYKKPKDTLAFHNYPKGQSLAAIGLYHRLVAMTPEAGGPSAVLEHYRKSAEAYETAGMEFPVDDEYHAWYLNCAVDMKLRCRPHVQEVLIIMEEIRETVPEMKKLWEYSALYQAGRDAKLDRTLKLEERLREKLAAGELTEENEVPADMLWTV